MEAGAEKPYSYYRHLKANNIVDVLRPLLQSNGYSLRLTDGKFKAKHLSPDANTPWVHIKHTPGFDCNLWHNIIFNIVSSKLPVGKQFVPRHCQTCWKVCVKPRTLQQLFNLHEMQKKLDRPSKSGIEVRTSVPGLYGGYFYNKSHGAGLECYDIVKSAILENEFLAPLVDEVDEFGRTTRIILKRACTEFEHLVGRSDKWEITGEQAALEDLIDRYFVNENLDLVQHEHLTWDIKQRWIEWAWQNGDSTYARYTGGEPLYPAYVTYHQPELLAPARDEILFRKF